MDKLTEMQVFTRTVETGGFSTAARTLNLKPSTVSKLISRLEGRLKVRLLQRSTRHLSLTEEGQRFYQRCVTILSEIEQAEVEVTKQGNQVSGTLRITATVAFTRMRVLSHLPEFMARNPDLHIELDLSDLAVDMVHQSFDVGIRLTEQLDDSLVARKLATYRRVVCASPDYLAKYGYPNTPVDLVNHNCLTHLTLERLNHWNFGNDPSQLEKINVSGTYTVDSMYGLYEAVLAGIGVARLTEDIVGKDLINGNLIELLSNHAHQVVSIYLVYPHRRHVTAKVRAFIDFMLSKFNPDSR